MIRLALLAATALFITACSSPPPSPPQNPGALPVLQQAGPQAAAAPAGPPRDLEGSAWTLAWVPGFELPAQPLATLRFEGGRAAGTDGCNRYTTGYTRTPGQLRFGAKQAATLMACPPLAEAVATRFGAVLVETAAYRTESDTLTLLDAAGQPLARLQEQPNRIAGSSWQVSSVNNGRQAVVGVIAGTRLTMVFGADGRLSGSAGCNTYGASYTADGSAIRVGPPAATRKACAEPEGVMAQEAAFLAALQTAATQRLEGDWLELRTAGGALAVSARRVQP
ncbi:MAG: META domain-containing protein [Burkholderiales bacterium]|nr:META domain-containing protein [Burkholderiales bacterium]